MHAFWVDFFNRMCSKSADGVRYFPSKHPYGAIYKDTFVPWWQRNFPEIPVPGVSTMTKGRHHSDFSDVIGNRKKHHHNQCDKCHSLDDRRARGFASGLDREEYERDNAAHDKEIEDWRIVERYWMMTASQSPHLYNLVCADDTEKLCLPHWGTRNFKSTASSSTVRFIPWLVFDSSNGIWRYLYQPKNMWRKGANRYCTSMYYVIKGLKERAPSNQARTLVVIADNLSENKCNVNFAFYSGM